MAFFLLLVVFFPLILINMKRSLDTPWFLYPFTRLVGLIQDNYSIVNETLRSTTSLYVNLIGIKKENRLLRKENAKIQAHLANLTELRIKNNRLKKLLGFQQQVPMKLLTARVIGKDLISGRKTILINRGWMDGVKKLMAAISIGGVVGFIRQVNRNTSQVLLITDTEFVADSLVQRSRVRGLTEGLGRNTCRLYYLQREDDVLVGDLVVTSGINNIFPKGLPMGKVISIEQEHKNSIRKDIRLKPSINLQRLEEIFIVLNVNKEENPKPNLKTETGLEKMDFSS